MDKNIDIPAGKTFILKKNLIEGFTMNVNDKPIEVADGFQYILEFYNGDKYFKTSWFLSGEEDKKTNKEDFTNLLLQHIDILLKQDSKANQSPL